MFEKTARVMFATVVLSGLSSLCVISECKAARQVWLDTLDVQLAQSGYSTSKRNKSIDNNPIRLAGVEYARGVGTHPPGRFPIDLAGHAERFSALVGIDDERKTSGSAEFIVKGDGRVLFASGIMRGGEQPKRIDVDVRGIKLMELIVTVGGDDYSNDHTDWADAKIIMSGDASLRAVHPPKRNEFGVLADRIADHARNGKSSRTLRIASEAFRPESLILDSDRDPVDVILRRIDALVEHIKDMPDAPDLSACRRQLARFKALNAQVDVGDSTAREKLFHEIAKLRRRIAFSNPLVNFDRILFIKRHFNPNAEKTGNHMCDQYFGFNAIAGGGLFILEHPFSDNPKVRNVLENSICENGRFKGRKLTAHGGFLSPDLSWDGKTVYFAYTDIADNPQRYKWTQDNAWHIFKVNIDGSGLRQLTDGSTNDFDPCLLPNGRIAFISERRGGYGRCHGRPVPSFTLHSMNADGTDIVMLSPHETNEWHPSVDNNGMIIYTRWDYVDRGFNQAHHPWITTPDGRDSRAIHGNFAPSDRIRPHAEMDSRAIPGSYKIITTAACHHGQAYGSLVLVDPKVKDDDAMAPVRRITPDQLFPEAECATHRDPANYATAWPLSEYFYLCVYDSESKSNAGTRNNYGIYLLDAFGNTELLCRDPEISCLSPIPLRPRKRPPVIPHTTQVGKPLAAGEKFVPPDPETIAKTAHVGLINVYQTHYPFPEGTKIKSLRLIRLLPKTTPFADNPRVGYGHQKSARAVLGTVPVEEDGSAWFNLPVNTPVYIQAIDEEGLAVQSMRSATYVHPGEKLVCHGCHDNRHNAPVAADRYPLAFKRKPSDIKPEVDGANPFSFPRLVQPVLDEKCVSCHEKNRDKKAPNLGRGDLAKNQNKWFESYHNLREHAFYFDNAVFTTPRTVPGKFGARASKLYKMLTDGHHDVELSEEQMHRITLWLDSNSDFFGSYENLMAQAQGEIVLPTLE